MASVTGNTATLTLDSVVAKVKTMNWTGITVADIDVTNNTSLGTDQSTPELGQDWSAIPIREFIPGSIDFGSISATIVFEHGVALPMKGALVTTALSLPATIGKTGATATWTSKSYCNSVSVAGMGVDEETLVDINIKLSGPPVFVDETA